MKKSLVIVIAAALLLAIIGGCAILRPPSLQSSARRTWKDKSIAEITTRIAAPGWPSNEFAHLEARSTDDPSGDTDWLSNHVIVTRKGEWLAYANVCQKQDKRIHDLFLARGSDGRWYYSTYHFCVDMIVLRIDEQPDDLAAFVRTYFLQTFDGRSDDCLQKTWPASSR